MKSTGIVRNLDELGRIVIPKELRKIYEIKEGDPLKIFTDNGGKIILRKYEPDCIFCRQTNGITIYKGKNICKNCFAELKK